MMATVQTGYVIGSDGKIYVQVRDNSQFGFSICDDDQSWAGGIGLGNWTLIASNDSRITDEDRERLGWILDEQARRLLPNAETFMVASIINDDRELLEYIMRIVSSYMNVGLDGLKENLKSLISQDRGLSYGFHKGSWTGVIDKNLDLGLKLKYTVRNAVLKKFFDEVDWDSLTEYYKSEYYKSQSES